MSSGIGKRHRRRGALGAAIEWARARVARLSASPPLLPRRSPAAGASERLRHTRAAHVVEVARARGPSLDALPREASAWLVHAERALMGGDYALVEAARARADALPERPLVVAVDLFVHPLLVTRALDAGADALGVVARAASDDELAAVVAHARAHALGLAVECKDAGEVDRAHALGADAILVPAVDRDRLRPDPDAADSVKARAASLGLGALDVLAHAPQRGSADPAALDADPDPA